jgi:hypothetical protein
MATNNPFLGKASSQWYVEEDTPGVTPQNPVFTKIRNTGGFPVVAKDTLQSNELDNSGEITSIRTGNEQVSGEYGVELSQTSQDDLLASALSNEWQSGFTVASVEVTVDSVGKKFTRTAGDYVADGVEVGQLIRFDSLTGNNAKPFIVTSVSALVVTGAAITVELTDEVVTTDFNVGDYLETGNLCRTFSVLTWLVGKCGTVDKFIITRGVEFTSYNIEVAVNATVTGSFPFIGRKQEVIAMPPAGSTYAPDLTTKQFSGTDGKVVKDGAVLAYVTSMTIASDSAAAAQFELGSKYTAFVERGTITNTVSAAAFMEDVTLLEEYINETEVSITTILSGIDGAMSFSNPKTVLTAVSPDLSSATSITQSIEGTATGSTLQSSIVIQRLPAL